MVNLVRSVAVVPNNLPRQPTSFVGRVSELAKLRRVLEQHRLVTLVGAGGCGKTRLAQQLATEVIDQYTDGGWWVELAAVSGPGRVASAVAQVLGLREEGRPLIDTLAEQLGGLDALLILDNCEHVLSGCADLVDGLLRAAPNLRIIATSREPIRASGELTWWVPSLDQKSAVRLFIERAAQVRPEFNPDFAEIEIITEVCRRLDGIPLAIELATARVRMMHPVRILAALDDRFRLLTGGHRTATPRQQTMEASVAWSHDLLDDDEQILLRRLSVFTGGFSLDAAERVCTADPLNTYGVLDLLSCLVDKSLVQVELTSPVEDRYRLLEMVRVYAHQRLVESGDVDVTGARHAQFFLDLAERAEPELAASQGPMWLARLEREHDNLRAALERLDTTDAEASFLRLVTALTLFWELRGHLREGGRWFARALARKGQPSSARARALWGATHVAMYGDDFATAAQHGPQALATAEAVGDQWATARALNVLGYMQLFTQPEAARAGLTRSIDLGQKVGDNWAVAFALKMITVAWLIQEDHAQMQRSAEDLLREAKRLENKFFLAWSHFVLGWRAVHRGELEEARAALATSLAYCEEVGEPVTGGLAVVSLAEAQLLAGEYDAAQTRLQHFLARAGATGGALAAPFAEVMMATIRVAQGDAAGARRILEPLVEQMRVLGLPQLVGWALAILGAALLAAGEHQAAEDALREANKAGESIDNDWLVALANYHLGQLARQRGDFRRAENLHQDALARRARGEFHPGILDSLEALATLAVEHDSVTEATRILGAAAALRQVIGTARWSSDQANYDDVLTRVRDILNDADFETAWAEGQALSADQAVAYVSRARGERKRPSAGWASLTPTELEVVKLVATGLTNPQIGQRMFIGQGTVKTHLAHTFTKLGVASRAELAAEATRQGL
ncbi:MAG: LuxR C-terminal-related transcriptional regulator [Actinomycetota bacterium]|nr:LuxR C-terminal-related transcriptional regulator [Actinomycetota bacterium]